MNAELRIDLGAVASNVRTFVETSGVDVLAVVKADGFGAGIEDVARCALAAGAHWLGVTSLEEAEPLRAGGIHSPILSWLNPADADWNWALRHDIDVAVGSMDHLIAIERAARSLTRPARIHLHVDCGIARDGAPLPEWPALTARARLSERAGHLRVVGIMGHPSCADTPAWPHNKDERAAFDLALKIAHADGLTPSHLHLAATAAALHDPGARHTMVRIGAGLAGIDPAGLIDLAQPLTLTSRVIAVRRVVAGAGSGYGQTWRSSRDTWLGLLPIGYADGVPRRLDPAASMLIGGRRCTVVGRVSMDQTVVDLGEQAVPLGVVATLFGSGTQREPTVADWARWSDTIPHEIVTGIGTRVARKVMATPERWVS